MDFQANIPVFETIDSLAKFYAITQYIQIILNDAGEPEKTVIKYIRTPKSNNSCMKLRPRVRRSKRLIGKNTNK